MQRKHNIIILFLLTLLYSCGKMQSDQTEAIKPIKVQIQTIYQQTQVYTHTHIGRIEQVATIPLSISSGGIITQIYIAKGDHVKMGSPLLQVDTLQAFNAMQIANATLAQAQDGYNRAEQMYQKGGITEQKMVEIRAQLQQAKSMFAIAKKQLEDCTLKAPREGIIGECNLQVGQHIAPSIPIITLLDIEQFNVTFDIPEKDIADIQIGDKGVILVEAIQSDSLPITVIEKNLIANHLSHAYTIKASIHPLSDATKQQLLPGMISKVLLQAQQFEGIIIPPSCIHTQMDGTKVWVVEDGKAIRRTITIGKYTNDGVLILQGLNIGDQVIVSGYQKLYQGAPVTF